MVLAHLQAWESEEYCKERLGLDAALGPIDRSKLNVNGTSLADQLVESHYRAVSDTPNRQRTAQ